MAIKIQQTQGIFDSCKRHTYSSREIEQAW